MIFLKFVLRCAQTRRGALRAPAVILNVGRPSCSRRLQESNFALEHIIRQAYACHLLPLEKAWVSALLHKLLGATVSPAGSVHSRSNSPPDCYSLHSCRFATSTTRYIIKVTLPLKLSHHHFVVPLPRQREARVVALSST